jgi:hypothetical protein
VGVSNKKIAVRRMRPKISPEEVADKIANKQAPKSKLPVEHQEASDYYNQCARALNDLRSCTPEELSWVLENLKDGAYALGGLLSTIEDLRKEG